MNSTVLAVLIEPAEAVRIVERKPLDSGDVDFIGVDLAWRVYDIV